MRDVPRHRDEKMQMVRHQNEASNEESALQSSEAKFLERFKDKLVGQDGPSSLNANRHEIQRPIGEYPIQPL